MNCVKRRLFLNIRKRDKWTTNRICWPTKILEANFCTTFATSLMPVNNVSEVEICTKLNNLPLIIDESLKPVWDTTINMHAKSAKIYLFFLTNSHPRWLSQFKLSHNYKFMLDNHKVLAIETYVILNYGNSRSHLRAVHDYHHDYDY